MKSAGYSGLRWVIESAAADFERTASEQLVLLVIAFYANIEGATLSTFVGMRRLARETCLTLDGVQGIVKRLESKGLVRIDKSNPRKWIYALPTRVQGEVSERSATPNDGQSPDRSATPND